MTQPVGATEASPAAPGPEPSSSDSRVAPGGWRVTPSGLFGVVLTGLMIWVLLESQKWPTNAQLLPRTVSVFGLLMLAGYAIQGLVLARSTARRGQIMDIGRLDTSAIGRRQVVLRLALVVGSTALLVLAIWLVGFHWAIPVYVFLALWRLGKIRWWTALLVAAVFEAVLIGVYDHVMHITWHETLLDQLRGGLR